jgi:hypothetical protein
MKSTQEKLKKKWLTPKIYTIDPHDPRIGEIKKLFKQPKRRPAPQKSYPQDMSAEIKRSSRSQTYGSSDREKSRTLRLSEA